MLREGQELKIDQMYLWTDSKVVLQYFANEAHRFHIFVAESGESEKRLIQIIGITLILIKIQMIVHPEVSAELVNSNWLTGLRFFWGREIVTLVKTTLEPTVGDPKVKTTRALQISVIKDENFLEFSK